MVIHSNLDSLPVRVYTDHMLDEIKKAIGVIEPKRVYNIAEMRRKNLFPWISAKNPSAYVSTIVDDRLGDNILKAKITGQGRGRDYKIKGSNIIHFLSDKYDYIKRNEGGS